MSGSNIDDPSMKQVRELLMGTQLKDMDARLLRQEERFLREIAEMREHVKNRVESLEHFMKSESLSLLHRLQEEQTERTVAIKNEQEERAESLKKARNEREAAIAQLAKELAKREEALERKLIALSNTLDTTEQGLRQLLLSENMRLSEEIEEKYKDALNALSCTTAELRHDYISRSALSGVFAETALKFSGEWPPSCPVSEEEVRESDKQG